MPTSLVDSVVFRDIFGTEPMRRVWSDGNRTLRYLDISKPRSRGPRPASALSRPRQLPRSQTGEAGQHRLRTSAIEFSLGTRASKIDLRKEIGGFPAHAV
jgi:hypothetical protein